MINATFHKTTLDNGLRVLTEHHPHVQSATIGVWINAGSVWEEEHERGMAHLLEHMVFKGTRRRSMSQIAATMDSIGGQMNAFTEREVVCYHAKVLAEHTPIALELLCDLVATPTLKAVDLELEKGVIIEEIRAVQDAPEDLVEELFMETIWSRSRWGRSILGTPESVGSIRASDMRGFMTRHYTPRNVLVVAVGQVDHDDIVRQARQWLKALPGHGKTNRRGPRQPSVKASQIQVTRDTEQVHLCCGTRAYDHSDPRRFGAWMLDTILSGGYSSRLFQEIREKRGLCYSIGPISASYRTAAFWGVETSTSPAAARQVVRLIGRELRRAKERGVTRSDLKRAKLMSRASILLAEESSSAQMSRIARHELYFGRQRSTAEVLGELLSVTQTDVQQVANEMFDSTLMNMTAVGPFEDKAEPLHLDVG